MATMNRPHRRHLVALLLALTASLPASIARAQSVVVDSTKRHQTIDGFGTCLAGSEAKQSWWQSLYFDDLQASMVRIDITPTFKAPYSNLSYCSPWFGQAAPLTLDNNANGPDGSRTRRYTGPQDYSATFGGCSAPIAVMGTDIDKNAAFFDFTSAQSVSGTVAQMGLSKAAQLGGFELYASMWSPAPWVKVSSGNTYSGGAWPSPAAVPWPFIWGGNFAGGRIDVTGTPLAVFDDGTGPTSARTQFARGLAAFLHGFQKAYGVTFHAISIQNELNFEEFYNSATYPLASEYVAALKAARAELDKYPDLQPIRIIGPEDLMGGDAYGMWQYGGGGSEVDKNLHYLAAIDADPMATSALAGFAIHGYGADGVSSAGASSQLWSWWADGWQASPAGGIPANVKGFGAFGKPSWMTETSGEAPEWLAASKMGGFPDSGAFSIAIKLQQALTTGQESAWLYWQLTDGSPADDGHRETLTDATQLAGGAKYVAAKHFFRYVRPGAQRVDAAVSGSTSLLASAFVLDAAAALTVVLVNESPTAAMVGVTLPAAPAIASMQSFTSSDGKLWQQGSVMASGGMASVAVPGYGVVTLTGAGTPPAGDGGVPPGPDGGPGVDGGGGSGGDGGSGGNPENGGGSGGNSGCGCSLVESENASPLALLGALGGLFLLRSRRSAVRRPRVRDVAT
jgi:O-glycosyl hydrolase